MRSLAEFFGNFASVFSTHIRSASSGFVAAVCGAFGNPSPKLVDGARESDCDACRAVLLIAPVKDLPVKGSPVFEPKPMENMESMEEILLRRDGR